MKFDDSTYYSARCVRVLTFWMNNVDVLCPNRYKSVDYVYMYNVLQVEQ